MDWISIVFSRENAVIFYGQFFSRMYVTIPFIVEGKIRSVISFSFEPMIVSETDKTIECAFLSDCLTPVTFYDLRGFEPVDVLLDNEILKQIVEACGESPES